MSGGPGGSARGTVPGLATPYPLGAALPAVYAEDDFGQRFTAGLDVVLAPLFNVLDSLEAYFSPALAPADFVDYLATWVGAELEGTESLALRRRAVASAVALHRVRGTRQGLAAAVRLAFGVPPEITESGGAAWSVRPLGPFPGEPVAGLHVVLRVADPAAVDPHRLHAVVAAARPAHLPFTVAVTGTRTAASGPPTPHTPTPHTADPGAPGPLAPDPLAPDSPAPDSRTPEGA